MSNLPDAPTLALFSSRSPARLVARLAIALVLLGSLSGMSAFPANAGALYTAAFDGSQAIPPTDSEATGEGEFYLSADESRLHIRLRIRDLEGTMTACHVHQGRPGVYGSQLFHIGVFEDSVTADWNITNYGRTNLKNGELFVLIHTEENPNGEIRGQIYPAPSMSLTANLGGSEVVPPTGSAGTGTADLTLWTDGSRLHLDLSVANLSGSATAAHVHRAPAGSNGPIVWTVSPPDNRTVFRVTPTDEDIQDMLSHSLYIDVATAGFPQGEIRGQILGPGTAGLPNPGASPGTPSPDFDGTGDASGHTYCRAIPNPCGGDTELWLRTPAASGARVLILDPAGRVVWTSPAGVAHIAAGVRSGVGDGLSWSTEPNHADGAARAPSPFMDSRRIRWNGIDESGRPVPAGTYFVALRTDGANGTMTRAMSRLVVLR